MTLDCTRNGVMVIERGDGPTPSAERWVVSLGVCRLAEIVLFTNANPEGVYVRERILSTLGKLYLENLTGVVQP